MLAVSTVLCSTILRAEGLLRKQSLPTWTAADASDPASSKTLPAGNVAEDIQTLFHRDLSQSPTEADLEGDDTEVTESELRSRAMFHQTRLSAVTADRVTCRDGKRQRQRVTWCSASLVS